MPHTINGRVCAWIESRGEVFEAAFVCLPLGQVEVVQKPATKRCASGHEAKQWIERETAALGFPVEWVEPCRETAICVPTERRASVVS